MNNHTEDKDEFYRKSAPLAKMYVDEFLTNTIHNNAIDNCLKAMRNRLDSANSLTIDLMNSIMEDFHDLKKR